MQGPKWLVTSVSSRLCAWVFDLASEALAKRACCNSCGGRVLTPVTRIVAETRSVQYWCAGCSGFRLYRVEAGDYASLFFCTDGIQRVPSHEKETLRGANAADDWDFLLEQQSDAGSQGRTPSPLSSCNAQTA